MKYKQEVLKIYPDAQLCTWMSREHITDKFKMGWYIECYMSGRWSPIGPLVWNRKLVWKKCFINIQETLIEKMAE